MKMPTNIMPMSAGQGTDPFNDVHWCFEIKLDGFRIVAHIDNGKVKLQTRNLADYTGRYPQVVADLQKWNRSAILDGEIVALSDDGVTDFNALMNWKSYDDGPLYYFVFDLLWLDGKDYTKEPLYRRKNTLKHILPQSAVVIYHDAIKTFGIRCFQMAQGAGLEGIVAKKIDSIYKPGTRTKDWLKLKVMTEDDFIICGYTRNAGSGNLFSTFILGAYQGRVLKYIGEVGTGFSDRVQKEIASKMKVISKCPFPEVPVLTNRWRKTRPEHIGWCRPQLVCNVKYLELTKFHELRHASFRCLRPDKKAANVVH